MSPEILQTLAPFVPTGFAMVMLILSIRKMSEEVYIPKIAPLIVIGSPRLPRLRTSRSRARKSIGRLPRS